QVELTLFKYNLKNDGDILLKFENNVGTISHLTLVGPNTGESLAIVGDLPHGDVPGKLSANGTANLAILQLFSDSLDSSGAATIDASFEGTPQNFAVSGRANIRDGRLRYRNFPHGFEAINGPLTFDANRINVDEVHARLAEGDVTLTGAIEL